MGINFDRWTVLKLLEVATTIACLAFKRVTDDEASRLFLYLQKISREWSLLNNITWDRVGAAVADATYGGYVIITCALFIGRLTGELPTHKRITEYLLLGVGALLFIILGSLEFASLDSVPHDLVDNAAILGTLSLVTAALFLIDMGGPKAKKSQISSQTHQAVLTSSAAPSKSVTRTHETRSITEQVYDIEKEVESNEKELSPKSQRAKNINGHHVSYKNENNNLKMDSNGRYRDSMMYKKIKDEKPKSFDIYGQYDRMSPSYMYPEGQPDVQRPPSGPGDPGFVQYTAQHWGEPIQKTPRTSPTQV